MRLKSLFVSAPFSSSLIILISIVVIISPLSQVEAKDLGTYGHVFEISEKNLLDQILEGLQKAKSSGKMGAIQEDIQQKMTDRLMGSFERDGAPRVNQYRSWTYDPSLTVSMDLMDQKGEVFAEKGTKLNPLDRVPFGEDMLFINGEDPQQVAWARGQEGKIILVRGQPIKLEEELSRSLYFDQQASLRKKFDLKAYPTRISQKSEGDRFLTLEEISDLRAGSVHQSTSTPSSNSIDNLNDEDEGRNDGRGENSNEEEFIEVNKTEEPEGDVETMEKTGSSEGTIS